MRRWQERNPLTNRCRTIPTAAPSTTCAAGQERNPATNRCRAVQVKTAALTPCKATQERNPLTNRCRNVLAASTEAKACPAGQERNTATNRCRKAAGGGAKNLAAVKDVAGSSMTHNYRWWVAGVILTGSVGYAAYEWRYDLANAIYRLRSKKYSQRREKLPADKSGKQTLP